MPFVQIHDDAVIRVLYEDRDTIERYISDNEIDDCFLECANGVQLGWLFDGEQFTPPPGPALPLEHIRAAKLGDIMQGYNAAFAPIEAVYPAKERETWTIQLEEARAAQADPQAETPLLSTLVAMRGKGETVAAFAETVMTNNQAYRMLAGALTGQQQRMFAEVNVLDSIEAIQAYEVGYVAPQGLNYGG